MPRGRVASRKDAIAMQNEDPTAKTTDAALPRDIQEHLGRRLRSELHTEADKPAFLGEPSVPPQFEPLVRKLEAGEGGERQGYEAVKRALIGEEEARPSIEQLAPPATTIRPRIPKRPL